MSQEQPVRDQYTQPQATSTPGADHVQYPDVSHGEHNVESEHAREQLPETADGQPSSGADVMGDPMKPSNHQRRDFDANDVRPGEPVGSKPNPYVQQPPTTSARSPQTQGANPNVQRSAAENAGNPYVQQPQPTSNPSPQTPGGSGNPYVQPSSADSAGKTPMNTLTDVFNKWSKKAEGYTGNAGNYWTHLSTGPNFTETALGRLSAGTKIITEGGLANVFKKAFPPVSDKEQLRKTYACYLSTSTGPVAGTIFLSTDRLAFVSDSPLSLSPNPGQKTGGRQRGEQTGHYYKVAIPLDKVQTVNPTVNPKKAAEKYIQVETSDGHEFWFMGFVNYDKAVTNLQEAVNKGNVQGYDNPNDTGSNANVTAAQQSNVPPKYDAGAGQGNYPSAGTGQGNYPSTGTGHGNYPRNVNNNADGFSQHSSVPPNYDGTSQHSSVPPNYDSTSHQSSVPRNYDAGTGQGNFPNNVKNHDVRTSQQANAPNVPSNYDAGTGQGNYPTDVKNHDVPYAQQANVPPRYD